MCETALVFGTIVHSYASKRTIYGKRHVGVIIFFLSNIPVKPKSDLLHDSGPGWEEVALLPSVSEAGVLS